MFFGREGLEKEEGHSFGENGFKKMVDPVAELERQLGLYDMAQFTPPVPPTTQRG